jgi:hypothetical protein
MKKKECKKKKTYEPPRIETREIYEVNALGCAKCPSSSTISLTITCIRGIKKYS